MGGNYEIICFDVMNGGNQSSIYVESYKEALELLEEFSKEFHCVTLVIRTDKKGLI